MIDAPQIAINIVNINLAFLFKIALLTAIVLYGIISFFIYNKILALNRIVFFPPRTAANSVKTVALINFLAVVSLFFIALVIV